MAEEDHQANDGPDRPVPRLAARMRTLGEIVVPALALAALVYVLWLVMATFGLVLVPLAVAVLLAALLAPLVETLDQIRFPRWLATALVLLAGLATVGGLMTFAVNSLITGLGGLETAFGDAVRRLRDWLVRGPLRLNQQQLEALMNSLQTWVQENTQQLVNRATATASGVGRFAAGAVLALFALVFFMYDGDRIWRAVLRVVPKARRREVDARGRDAFGALAAYTRATIAVAVVDSVVIGIGLAVLGVPLVIPLASLVFLGAFVPFVGAFVAGFVSVLVALVAGGPVTALLVLALNVGVQQLEGNVLQPFLLGRAVRLHPLVVVVVILVGTVLAGIVGAVLAVPVVIAARAFASSL